jgi:hypothetical protein
MGGERERERERDVGTRPLKYWIAAKKMEELGK